MTLLFTGERSLEHDQLTALCEETIQSAKELFTYLPSVIGLGILLRCIY